MKILFQGDSITDGARLKPVEKRWDKNHQIGHSYAYIVSAKLGFNMSSLIGEFRAMIFSALKTDGKRTRSRSIPIFSAYWSE